MMAASLFLSLLLTLSPAEAPVAPGTKVLHAEPLNESLLKSWRGLEGHAKGDASFRLGEQAADDFARKQGWTKLHGETKVGGHGVDRIYQRPDGRLVLLEAKGPGGQFKVLESGLRQGTPGYNVDRVVNVLARENPELAKKVLQALAEGQGESAVSIVAPSGKHTVAVHPPCATAARSAREALAALVKTTAATATVQTKPETAAPKPQPPAAPKPQPAAPKAAPKLTPAPQPAAPKAPSVPLPKAAPTTVVGQVLKGGARALPLVGAGVETYRAGSEAYEVEGQYRSGEITQHERIRSHAGNAGHTVGGMTGAGAGAYGGATSGAAIGSFFGPVGTVVGGTGGAIIGGVTGYFGGSWFGRKAGEGIADVVDR